MTSRFFLLLFVVILFFGSEHPEALLFSVCVLADYTLSLVLFLDIYI